jgi:hypothetical protein
MKVQLSGLFAALMLCGLSTANADPITYVVSGVISPLGGYSPSSGTYGIDAGGYFGPPGASIVGDAYIVTWTLASDCECIGAAGGSFGRSFPLPNPVIDVVLTINGRSYDFGNYGNFVYGEVYLGDGHTSLNIQQTQSSNGTDMISTSVGFSHNPLATGGLFQIGGVGLDGGGHCSCTITAGGFFNVSVPSPIINVSVPSPIMGAGLSGLMLVSGGLLIWLGRIVRVNHIFRLFLRSRIGESKRH